MALIRWFTLWLITRRAVKAHKKRGYNSGELVNRITAQSRYANVLAMLGISDHELKRVIKKKVGK